MNDQPWLTGSKDPWVRIPPFGSLQPSLCHLRKRDQGVGVVERITRRDLDLRLARLPKRPAVPEGILGFLRGPSGVGRIRLEEGIEQISLRGQGTALQQPRGWTYVISLPDTIH